MARPHPLHPRGCAGAPRGGEKRAGGGRAGVWAAAAAGCRQGEPAARRSGGGGGERCRRSEPDSGIARPHPRKSTEPCETGRRSARRRGELFAREKEKTGLKTELCVVVCRVPPPPPPAAPALGVAPAGGFFPPGSLRCVPVAEPRLREGSRWLRNGFGGVLSHFGKW